MRKQIKKMEVSKEIGEAIVQDNALQTINLDFHDLFNHSLDCIYIHDFKGNLIDANPTTLALLGYEKGELKSLNFASFMGREERIKALKAIDIIIKTGYQRTLTEYKLRHKNGTDSYIETKGSIIYRDKNPTSFWA